MKNRNCEIIDFNPVMPHVFVSKLKRPSNQKGFYEAGGLKEILCDLFLNEFLSDPLNFRKFIVFCRNEEDLIQLYECVELILGARFTNMKTRPWVQYHGSLGEKTLKWIHKSISSNGELEVKLLISTYKLVMGVDVKNLDLAVFIRYRILLKDSFYLIVSDPQIPSHAWSKELADWGEPTHLVADVPEQ